MTFAAKHKSLYQKTTEEDGVAAFRRGDAEDSCPHEKGCGTGKRQWWYNGFFAAKSLAKFPRFFTLPDLLALLLLFVCGCGIGFAPPAVTPVKPIPSPGRDAAHVIPAATREYHAGLAALYESLAVATESGEVKTVRDAATKAVARDKELRTEYRRALADVMETRLGSEELPDDAAVLFREMSAAFGRLAK